MNGKWKQRLHLEPPQGWLNDPNGLSFFNGKYQVYFQYSPESVDGSGQKCWGHYESKDLISWDFTGTVLFPDTPDDKDGVYSGSAIENDGMLNIFYTGNVKEEGNHDYITSGRGANVIKVTTSDGVQMSEKKTILRNCDYPNYCSCHVRDPKVWEENGEYHMVLGARTLNDTGCVLFYKSKNLDEWEFDKVLNSKDFGYMWECPDLFSIDGHRFLSVSPQGLSHGDTRFQNVYSSGYFKADNFILSDFEEFDYGFDFYAPQTFEAPDGRRILIGWMGIGDIPYTNPETELGRQHCLTLPRELTVLDDGKIAQNPICEIDGLRGEKNSFSSGDSIECSLPFDLTAKCNGDFEICIKNILKLSYNGTIFSLEFTDNICSGGRTIRKAEIKNCSDIRVLGDMSSLEIYLDVGRKVLSTRFYPHSESVWLDFNNINGEIYKLNPMEVNIIGK